VPAPELDPSMHARRESLYRRAGFVDLRSYAPIGDGRTIALVALDGGIDWLPLPHLDSLPVFAGLLDEKNGGRLELAPDGPFSSRRRYLPGTNVLETTFTTESGMVRVTDALNVGVDGKLPWTELARRVDGVEGRVAMQWRVSPGTCFNTASPWTRKTPHGTVLRANDLSLGVAVSDGMQVDLTDQAASGRFVVADGERRVVGVLAAHAEPLMLSSASEIDRGLDRTIEVWQGWSDQFDCSGPRQDAVRRSVLMLKLLIHQPTGSIAAAATTSLPERLAGDRNWDYRYAWIRDAAYTLAALRRFGIREETHAAVSWLLRTARQHGPEMGVFFQLDGSSGDPVRTYDVPGWRGIGPVVTGNRADTQLQLSVFADLFDTVRLYAESGHVLDTETGHLLTGFADQACEDRLLAGVAMRRSSRRDRTNSRRPRAVGA
jgi:GH15 family glucan-1,4-alpha-glucosidase